MTPADEANYLKLVSELRDTAERLKRKTCGVLADMNVTNEEDRKIKETLYDCLEHASGIEFRSWALEAAVKKASRGP